MSWFYSLEQGGFT
ncbi:hypothetical protein RDI58_028773 [Solanum bulbocastanum]|uniref:Uncharacterized protein n=1 Tax=Solanum bulbocastanum TaxID=147425 RepID=A0AAN8SSK0_SOLBU